MEHTPMHRVAAASAIGTILEWYDFALYNAMSGLVFNKDFLSLLRSTRRYVALVPDLRRRHGGTAGRRHYLRSAR